MLLVQVCLIFFFQAEDGIRDPLVTGVQTCALPICLSLSMLAWGGIGSLCLGLAVWRLRPAYLRQLQGEGRPKKFGWWRARRAPVPDEPIRWKERQVDGLAPLAALRRVPRWFGITVIFLVTVTSSVLILWSHRRGEVSFAELTAMKIDDLLAVFAPAAKAFRGQSIVALLVAAVLIGLR